MNYVYIEPSYLLALTSAGYDSRPYWTKIYSPDTYMQGSLKNNLIRFTYTTELEQWNANIAFAQVDLSPLADHKPGN